MCAETKQERKQMAVRSRFLCLALILCALSACGKKGPLYLPPGMIPVLKPVPESTVEPTTEPATVPAAKNTDKTSPAAKPTSNSQP